ncbi:DUF5906 domain-containing protein [Sphingomonas colocasiae]|uniref:DUF5906 domain-containing protein n=1 Tax=Sphingomonas colocasiae TaxID=1848973 RepID=A0ABS7PRP0_9SPHN|nr:DUF5906 domain-containing protein [Sphingomonas colocasiae]MBY8823846.1 DUF5906 domain-containing protein [Sphingomonas colocasiae]
MEIFDSENAGEVPFEALSSELRAYLGGIQPWGNPSYLANEMGADTPVIPWREGMPPSTFSCPCCKGGTVIATAHRNTAGVMTLTCDRGCSQHRVATKSKRVAPRAFRYNDDLLEPMPHAMLEAISARLNEGVYNADYPDVMRMLDLIRGKAQKKTMYRATTSSGTIAVVVRGDWTEAGANSKIIRQVHAVRNVDGNVVAVVGLPKGPWPLVGQDEVLSRTDAPILHVEGEKTREAAGALFPSFVPTTSLCGAQNPHHSDWSCMHDRDVTIVGDNDAAGKQYAESVAAQAFAVRARSVRIVKLPSGLPDGWDLADALENGVSAEDLAVAVTNAPAVEWDAVKHAMRSQHDVLHWPPLRLPDGHLRNKHHVVSAVEEALKRIDSGCRRGTWLGILGCIFHAFGTDGLGIAIAWSKSDRERHGKFCEGEVEQIFDQFVLQPFPTPMLVRDLFWRAWRESSAKSDDGNGWRPAPDAIAEAELAAFEAEHRKFQQGDNVKIGVQKRMEDGSYQVERVSEDTMKTLYKSRRVKGFDGKKEMSIFDLWSLHQRISPQELVFRPGLEVGPSQFNMFQGFKIRPVKNAGSYREFRILIDRISAENEIRNDYLWKLLAYRFQNLNTFVPVAVIFRGPRGAMKTTLTTVIRNLLAPYSVSISDPDNLAGRNNGILQDKLFVQAEEIEVRTEDQNRRLNNYITNDMIDYIDKYKAQWTGENRTFMAMTSNAFSPVKIAPDDRRYLVLNVSDPFNGDEEARGKVWLRMHAELESGGYEALMYDLLHTDLSGFNVRAIPKTPLFRELASYDMDKEPVVSWWHEILLDGGIEWADGAVNAWTDPVAKDALYQRYRGWCEDNGTAARTSILSKSMWAKRLKEITGGKLTATRVRQSDGSRKWFFVFPSYEECCAAFEREFRTTIERAPAPDRVQPKM